MPEKYDQQKVTISIDQFKYFVEKLNSSGFWQRSCRNDCDRVPTDGDGFGIEAAINTKYHFVTSDYCQGDYENSTLKKMIDELLSFVHFDLESFYIEDFPLQKEKAKAQ